MDGLGVFSTILGGFESFGQAGELAVSAAGMKANAGILDVSAQGELAAGKLQGQEYGREASKFIGRQRAMYAKAGVRFSGSPALMWAESEKNLRMDVLNTHLNAAYKANALGFEALNKRIASGNARTSAVASMGSGILKMATGLSTTWAAETSVLNGGNKSASPSDIENYVSRGR